MLWHTWRSDKVVDQFPHQPSHRAQQLKPGHQACKASKCSYRPGHLISCLQRLVDYKYSSPVQPIVGSFPPLWGAAFSLLIASSAVQKLFDFTHLSIPGALCRKPLPLLAPYNVFPTFPLAVSEPLRSVRQFGWT